MSQTSSRKRNKRRRASCPARLSLNKETMLEFSPFVASENCRRLIQRNHSRYFPALANRYEIVEHLHQSVFGAVKLARDNHYINNNHLVCIKISNLKLIQSGYAYTGDRVTENPYLEAALLRFIQQKSVEDENLKYIVQYVDELVDKEFHYLVTEFIPGSDLFTILSKANQSLSLAYIQSIFLQVCTTLKALHRYHIVHRDISLENIMLNQRTNAIKLIDFGIAIMHPNSVFQKQLCPILPLSIHFPRYRNLMLHIVTHDQQCRLVDPNHHFPVLKRGQYVASGRCGYLSPEAYNNDHSGWDGYQNDVYALGPLLYLFMTRRPPYSKPKADEDIWFSVIFSGEWLKSSVRFQPAAQIYNRLPQRLLSLVNQIIAPLSERISLDRIIAALAVSH